MTAQPTDVNLAIRATALPSKAEVAKRSNIAIQLVRFVLLNLKILKLSRQHHGVHDGVEPLLARFATRDSQARRSAWLSRLHTRHRREREQ